LRITDFFFFFACERSSSITVNCFVKIYPVLIYNIKIDILLSSTIKILLVLLIHATCFIRTDYPQVFKYMMFNNKMHIYIYIYMCVCVCVCVLSM
jgi:hypothetical protein